ncbi:ephrin-B2 isoform X2 [Brachionus plicatilis]|uniref:Ephrin-B2 isoform X2 n=1 Tax=Brachionus plicatilis TaxID=10195 RepID=A0A3M7PAK8_BRAPC|nr:ephrin-B2 isoform X2 [Brachionus plicatilis]
MTFKSSCHRSVGYHVHFVIFRHVKTSPFFILSLLFLFNNVQCLSNRPIDPIVWSAKNKMFDSRSTPTDKSVKNDHLIHVRIGEFLNIICPKYSANSLDNDKAEYHVLYQVSKKEYNECKIDNIQQRVPVLKCDRPYENVKYTLYISKFSPVPDAIEFTPGSKYYFISTSDGTFNGLHNSQGGTCKTHNMKITVKVLDPKNYITTKKSQIYNFRKSTNIVQVTSSKMYQIDSNTRNLDPLSMKILSSLDEESPATAKSSLHSTITTTLRTTTTPISTTKMSETVDDNIFILEPEIIDYNDILSQLISTSSAYSNSNVFNKKQTNRESLESGHLNKAQSCLFSDLSFRNYLFLLTIYCHLYFFFQSIIF